MDSFSSFHLPLRGTVDSSVYLKSNPNAQRAAGAGWCSLQIKHNDAIVTDAYIRKFHLEGGPICVFFHGIVEANQVTGCVSV